MSVYAMKCLSNSEEYIKLNGNISKIHIPVLNSQIHLLTKESERFEISPNGGLEIPDLIYHEGIYFVSDSIKDLLTVENVDYIFWKKADIVSEKFGIHETFWIMVPPKIDCIDIDNSDINLSDWDFGNGIVPMFECNSIDIIEKMLGRYEVFKILGILDNNIYFTKRIYKKIISHNFIGIDFIKIK